MDVSLIRLDAGWADSFHALRLHSLQTDPKSFANHFEQEREWPIARRIELLEQSYVWGGVTASGDLISILALSPYDPFTMKHKARMHSVYVHPDYRGSGLSRRMIEQAVRESEEWFDILTLAVDAANKPAITLYESLGFEAFGYECHARYYGEERADDVWMIRHKEEL